MSFARLHNNLARCLLSVHDKLFARQRNVFLDCQTSLLPYQNEILKGLFHPAFLARVVSCLAFVCVCCQGGGKGLGDGRRSAARFSERYPLLITERAVMPTFMMNFGGKRTIFWSFLANFWITHPCLWNICRKRDPFLENFGSKTHPYGRHIPVPSTLNMLCTPRGCQFHGP